MRSIVPITIFLIIPVIFLEIFEFDIDSNLGGNQSYIFPSEITEFYIDPEQMDDILENAISSSSEIEIPLVIVNHNPETINYKIAIINENRTAYEKGGISVSSGDSWRGNVAVPRVIFKSSPYFDILLFANSTQLPVAQLRLWH